MELLAPAGSFDSLMAAVQSGADAVYIGGKSFSARKGASNFSKEEIKKAVDYCHLRGVSLHVAANILVKERERQQFLDYIGELYEAGVDAVIIQDIGMASLVHSIFPHLSIHASTQMTASSVDAVKFLKNMGFSRIVLSRELSLEAIEKICKSTDAEIEVFIHGAICMSYSGQCLMSSIIGGRSGNRGMCAQPCRLPYTIGKKKAYHLSPKDMCLADKLQKLERAGVTSLKIEGRLKRKEYVAAVCGVYRRLLDSGKSPENQDISELLNAFNRSGFTSGYLDSEIGKAMMSLDNPSNISENTFSEETKKRCEKGYDTRKTEIYMSADLAEGTPLTLNIWDNLGHFALAKSDQVAEKAQTTPLSRDRLFSQLTKLGGTPFFAEDVQIELEEGITIPIGEINKTRRMALEGLTKQIISTERTTPSVYPPEKYNRDYREVPVLTAYVTSFEQARACAEAGIKLIYADTPLANKLYGKLGDTEIVAKLPPIKRDDRNYEKAQTHSILISNIGQIDKTKRCIGDFRLNITNSESVKFFDELEYVTLSPELNLKELEGICAGQEIIGYGRIPLMVMENCPLKNSGKCQNFEMLHSLIDRKREGFPVRCSEGCVCEILNSKPIYMADKIDFVKKLKIRSLRLVFTVENFVECGKIINEYKLALSGQPVNAPKENTFTRGHFFRGTE